MNNTFNDLFNKLEDLWNKYENNPTNYMNEIMDKLDQEEKYFCETTNKKYTGNFNNNLMTNNIKEQYIYALFSLHFLNNEVEIYEGCKLKTGYNTLDIDINADFLIGFRSITNNKIIIQPFDHTINIYNDKPVLAYLNHYPIPLNLFKIIRPNKCIFPINMLNIANKINIYCENEAIPIYGIINYKYRNDILNYKGTFSYYNENKNILYVSKNNNINNDKNIMEINDYPIKIFNYWKIKAMIKKRWLSIIEEELIIKTWHPNRLEWVLDINDNHLIN